MNLEISLSPAAEQALRKYAAATGKDLEAVVLDAVCEKITAEDISTSPSDFAAWDERFGRWVASHPVLTQFADDSRESIY